MLVNCTSSYESVPSGKHGTARAMAAEKMSRRANYLVVTAIVVCHTTSYSDSYKLLEVYSGGEAHASYQEVFQSPQLRHPDFRFV